ncbi:MAG: hypothetical protein ACE5FJ_12755 [Gemmatimonadales bacterium]
MLALIALLLSAGWSDTGEDVVRMMHERYEGRWYEHLTFVQRTSYYDIGSGELDSARIWYESLALPGRLRIDLAPLSSGDGILFRNDSLYVLRSDSIVFATSRIHQLLLLGFDVYHLPVEMSIARLRGLGYDLSRMYEAEWQGRDVYVVGAESAADRSNQFWIDRGRLVFVRELRYPPNGAEVEVQFNRYYEGGGGWIAPEVVFKVNGRMTLHEEYGNIRTDIDLEPAVFLLESGAKTPWVRD